MLCSLACFSRHSTGCRAAAWTGSSPMHLHASVSTPEAGPTLVAQTAHMALLCRLSSMVRTQWCRITTLVPLRKSTRPHTAKQYWSDMCLRSRGNRRIYLHGQCVESFWTCLIWLTGLGESRPQASVIIQSGLSGSRSIGSRSK